MKLKDWLMDQPQNEPVTAEEMDDKHETDIRKNDAP